jgi:UDP-GlcNAc:undecaprenyl-phosphate/decaprenyl-phosphate GlcNAc-1-phosphate transferase
MGDTGSLLIGLMLAYAPISSLALLDPYSLTDPTAYAAGTVNRYGAFIPLLVPAAILLIPYADLLMAVVRRTRAGTSVFTPDKKHLQHRLLAIGHSHRTSVLIMYLWTALFAGTVIWLSIVRTPLIVLAIVTVAAIVALLLVTMPRLRPWSRVTAADGTARVARQAAPVPVKAAGERAAVTPPPERTAWQPDGRTALGGNGGPSSGAARPGSADPVTGVPGTGAPGGGTTSGPGIPAAAISGGAPPWEDSRVGPPWDTVRGGPPWDSVRGGPPWESIRHGPPWEKVRGDRYWDTVRDDDPPAGPGSDPGAPPWPSEPPQLP